MKHMILLLLLGFSTGLSAQQIISINKDTGRAPYTYAGERLNMRRIGEVLESNPEAYGIYKKAKGTSFIANTLTGTGSLLFGNEIWNTLNKNNGQEFDAVLFVAGIAITGTGIAIAGGANKRLAQGIERYNLDYPPAPAGPETSLNLGVTTNGIGLVFSF
jgi:hypothetical protein